MCLSFGDFEIGSRDVLLGTVAGVPFFMGSDQFKLWKHTALTLDVVPGRGSGFSLEAPQGVRFLIRRSRVQKRNELEALEASAARLRGDEALRSLSPPVP